MDFRPITKQNAIVAWIVVASFFFACFAAAQSKHTRIIQPGELVDVSYTCRLEDGRLVTTNEPSALENQTDEGSVLFSERKEYAPEALRAGKQPERDTLSDAAPGTENLPSLQLLGLHEVLHEKLSDAVVGREAGQRFTVELTADPQKDVPEPERKVSLVRSKKVPKSVRIARNEYMAQTGSPVPPEVGQGVAMYPGVAGRVVSMTENEVEIAFSIPPQETKTTIFGERRTYDKGDHFLVKTEVVEGHLIRTGPHLGRVASVEGGVFVVDYSHPFGGHPLICDVVAEPQSDVWVESPEGKPSNEAKASGQETASKEETSEQPGKKLSPEKEAPSVRASSSSSPSQDPAHPIVVEEGDLVEAHYTARLENGRLIYTTREDVAEASSTQTVDWYQKPAEFAIEWVTVGQKTSLPGLGNALIGMKPGEKSQVTLPPEKAFGLPNPSLTRQYNTVRTRPISQHLSPKEWSETFQTFPVEGKTYDYDRYLKTRVTEMGESGVTVVFLPRAPRVDRPVGTVLVRAVEDRIEMELVPKIGEPYVTEGKNGPITGRIVSASEKRFTVDYNHPLAGKNIALEVEVVSVVKASELKNQTIPWLESHDQGLALAEKQDKPMFLVLYADWCGYSKKLLNETLKDPRVQLLSKEFVWVKVDSHKKEDLKAFYEQDGYPMMVVLSPEGEILKTIQGYKDAAFLYKSLKAFSGEGTVSVKRTITTG